MPSYPGFLGPAYKSKSYTADSEICLNFFLEKNESPTAPNPYVMLSCPGFEVAWSVPQSPVRGAFYQRGRAFTVVGFAFYEVFDGGNTLQRGTVENDGQPVTINANGDAGNQLWITSGGVGYVYDLSSDTLSVEGVGGTAVSMGGFLAGRFLYLDADSGAFYASALYDGTTWDPLAVAQSDSGDPWRALIVTPDNLIRLLGESSSECWEGRNTLPMPFGKIQESGIPYGLVAPWAWALGTTLAWVAQNKQGKAQIVRAHGYQPDRISTHAIENEIQDYDDLSDTIGFNYQQGGHEFDVFTFPDAQKTWVCDRTTNLWHQRDYWDTATATSKAYRPGCMMEAFGKTYVGDRLSGDIYEISTAFHLDVDGNVIRRVRQPPRFSLEQRRLTVNSVQLVMDVGQGVPAIIGAPPAANGSAWGDAWGDSWGDAWGSLVDVPGDQPVGANPQMMLRVSRDGGKTFPLERWADTGRIGEWNQRVFWLMLGQGRNFTPQFVATDPVPWAITDCLIDYRVGRS